jgi:calcineurin-like phosphoesterase family protein
MQKLHIDLQGGQKVWFTSDLHFGHRNVLKFCNRPWKDEKEMGKSLIENWNNTVGDNDIVFVLGDTFWFNNSRSIKKVLSQLKGKDIYIIPGNHDDFKSYHRVDDPRIHLCADVVTCWITEELKPKREVYLQHCPASTWPHRENGAYHFFGHIHSQPDKFEGVDQDLFLHWNQADVGCDFWKWTPVDFDTLIDYCKMKKKETEELVEMFNKLRRLSKLPKTI